jgi:hypothetical protein
LVHNIKLDEKYTIKPRKNMDGKFVSVYEKLCKNIPLDINKQKWTKIDIMMETHTTFHSVIIFHWATNKWRYEKETFFIVTAMKT